MMHSHRLRSMPLAARWQRLVACDDPGDRRGADFPGLAQRYDPHVKDGGFGGCPYAPGWSFEEVTTRLDSDLVAGAERAPWQMRRASEMRGRGLCWIAVTWGRNREIHGGKGVPGDESARTTDGPSSATVWAFDLVSADSSPLATIQEYLRPMGVRVRPRGPCRSGC
jgi:hypothetical protein